MAFRIRGATESDALFVAEGVYEAFEGHLREGSMSVRMPSLTREQRIHAVRTALAHEGGTAFSLPCFLVAEEAESGRVAASLCPYEDREFPRNWEVFDERLVAAVEAAKGPEAAQHCARVGALIADGWTHVREPEGKFHVELIYVAPPYRGTGALDALFAEAWRDRPEVHLSCLRENARAIRAYEKRGFRVFFEFSYPGIQQVLGTNGFVFMQRKKE